MPATEHASDESTTIEHLGTLADGRSFVRVCCSVDPSASGAPEWIHVVPPGPYIEARDRRSFRFSDPGPLLAASELPLLLDWEHMSEQPGGSTRAAGWVEELRYHDGSTPEFPRPGLWAKASWTHEGKRDIESRAYRYLSPVLLLDAETREIQQLVSVALTNTPALRMHAVEQFRERLSTRFGSLTAPEQPKDPIMDVETLKALCGALGVAEDADHAALVEAATQAVQLKATCTQLTTELSQAKTELEAAKAKLADVERAQFAAEVDRVLDDASKAGKIPPAAIPAWREFCSLKRENLSHFKDALLPTLPSMFERAPKSVPAVDEGDDLPSPAVLEKLKAQGLTVEQIRTAYKHNKATRAQSSESDSE